MKTLPILIITFFLCFSMDAQVVTQTTDHKFIEKLLQLDSLENIATETILDLPNQTIADLEAEDVVNESKSVPWRFAKLIETNISITSNGTLKSVGNTWVWALKIKTNNAKSLSLTFKNLQLTKGAEIFLFTNEKKVIYGPLTKEMYTTTEEISTEVLPGNSIFVLYRIPKSMEVIDNVVISKIGFGYRNGGSAFRNEGAVEDRTLSCHTDVTTATGDCFRMEQRAVARTLINNSSSLCTATLINNTQNNLRPFLITANHCSFDNASNPVNFANLGIRFLFYQGNSSIITFIGATERVSTGAISDCSLLEMTQTPTSNQGLIFLGWDRSTTPPTTSRVLHHPSGDLMKISGDLDASITNTAALTFGRFMLPTSSAWRFNSGDNVAGGDFGALEGGSSGSALINPIHRIIGDLKGGNNQTCNGNNGSNATTLWYGRFDVSYSPSGVPTTSAALRLENWLNPTFNNTQNLDARFQINGSSIIPCTYLPQYLNAPLLQTSGGVQYTYVWTKSSNLTLLGNSSSIQFYANSTCTSCATWVSCQIRTPVSCGDQLIATSVVRNFTFGTANDAKFVQTITPASNNNGSILNDYNTVCSGGTYSISTNLTGIPIPPNTQLLWTSNSGPVTIYQGYLGCSFTTNSPGVANITCSVVNGQGCLAGYSKTYTFNIISPCTTPFSNYNTPQKLDN
jgi:lysyl endopeptidase